jgi:lysozyme
MRRRLIRFAAAGIGLSIAAGLAYAYARSWRPSPARFPIQGVDVSHHQGEIDWTRVKATGADFAYLKATEGGDHRDSQFARNWRDAQAAGLRVGAYHFFTLCRSGTAQAANFIATVPRDLNALAPVVDLEFGGNCATRPDRAAVLAELGAMLRSIEAHNGKPAILYLTREFDEAYRISASVPRPLWLRSLFLQPRFGARPWRLWQASNMRHVDGIEGRVDWNVMQPETGKSANRG